MLRRREFLAAAAVSALHATDANAIVVDPTPLFEISPLLYMQFMEPLGATDSAVEASWDYDADDWRKDFVEITRELAPGAMRFGGLFSRYYRWREGIGPAAKRPPMRNYVWGGMETNRVGTHEFVDFSRRVGAEPFYCVNFLSDGEKRYASAGRTADAREAADWVSYTNDPDNRERKANGASAPLNVKLWQIGNETSYGTVTFTKEEAIAHTVEFAKAMKQRDPSIRLIGWGDRGRDRSLWAPDLYKAAGEYLDFTAIHMMGQSPKRSDTVLKGLQYEKDPERAWEELIELSDAVEKRVVEIEQAATGGIAITEGHLSLSPHNTNPILFEWLSAAYHARSMNIYQRHGARVKIATGADFHGTRWTNTAVMLPVPRGRSYLMPAGSIAGLFKRHNGTHAVAVKSAPAGLDIAASRAGDKLYLHVANLNYGRAVEASFAAIRSGRVFEIAPEDLRTYVNQDRTDVFRPREKALTATWRFPAGSVSAVEMDV
jgi:alpha-N-arabinofuranosidase